MTTSKLDAIAARLEAPRPYPESLLLEGPMADLAALLEFARIVVDLRRRIAEAQSLRIAISQDGIARTLDRALAPLTEGENEGRPCNCGFGGTHDPDNPRCVVNDPSEAWLNDAEEEADAG